VIIKDKILIKALSLVFFVFLINLIAIIFHFYFIFWWFDLIMHFLGGFFVVLLALWFYFLSGYVKLKFNASVLAIISVSLLVVFIIGLLWEVLELVIRTSNLSTPQEVLDIFSDLLLDLMGGFFSGLYFWNQYKKI